MRRLRLSWWWSTYYWGLYYVRFHAASVVQIGPLQIVWLDRSVS